jgi:prolyl-tRNA editing enzyme YbaK/EbsC (Cys-tRNA(Pro) deacylase)
VHPNCVAVDAILEAGGCPGRVRLLPDAAPTATAAAAQLGVDVGAIANSLVFATPDGVPVLVMTSGAHRVDTGKVAALLGVTALDRASADLVYSATGQRIGGVAPIGHPSPLRTVVDVTLANYPEIWAAGGIPHAIFPTTYEELLRLTGGRAAEVA